jgi:hypothetical protein
VQQIAFQLRTNIDYFETSGPCLDLEGRVKQMALLSDQLYFEEGMLQFMVGPRGSWEVRHPPGSYDDEALAWHRSKRQKGAPFTIAMGLESAPGVGAPPDAMQTVLESPLDAAYCAEFGTLLRASRLIEQSWVGTLRLTPEGQDDVKQAAGAIRDRALRSGVESSGFLASSAVDHLAHDLAFSAVVGRPVAIDETHAPVLTRLAEGSNGVGPSDANGARPLQLWAPDFTRIPWPEIIALHDHDALGAFREKLTAAEAATASIGDLNERALAIKEIGLEEASRAIKRLTPTYRELAADVLLDTAVGFIPFASNVLSVARGVKKIEDAHADWFAVLLRLRERQAD